MSSATVSSAIVSSAIVSSAIVSSAIVSGVALPQALHRPGLFLALTRAGLAYTVEDAPYYGIESVWSASNLWVNMQTEKPPSAMSYDLQVRLG